MPQILFTLKCLLFSYILTGGLLLLLAFLLYRLHLSEKVVNVCMILIYIATSFFAGFITGKKKGKRKFFWGAAMGALYFAVLFMVSVIVNRSFPQLSSDFITTILLCTGGGMRGGMLSGCPCRFILTAVRAFCRCCRDTFIPAGFKNCEKKTGGIPETECFLIRETCGAAHTHTHNRSVHGNNPC